jgi:OmpA-OmpF porin, OOP family
LNEPVPHKLSLRADTLFRFDGADHAAMLPAGKLELDALVAPLKAAPVDTRLTITGYTDRLGDNAYNQRLSLQRARTVQHYLRDRGVTLPISAQGRGSANQRVECSQTRRAELVQCLAPNRRVELEFAGAD